MQTLDLLDLLILVGAFFVAGATKGISGIALPAVTVGLLTFFYAPRLAVALLIPAVFYTNLRQMRGAIPVLEIAKEYRVFIAISCVTVFCVALIGAQMPISILFICVGLAQVTFAIFGLLNRVPKLNPAFDRITQTIAGLAAGILGGLTAIWGPPVVAYLTAKRLEKEVMIQVLGLLLTFQAGFLLLGFILSGELTPRLGAIGVAMIIPAILGMMVGERIRAGFDTAQFMRVLLLVFLALGLNLIRRGIWG